MQFAIKRWKLENQLDQQHLNFSNLVNCSFLVFPLWIITGNIKGVKKNGLRSFLNGSSTEFMQMGENMTYRRKHNVQTEAPYLHLRHDVRGQHKHHIPESERTDLSSKVEVIYIQTKIKNRSVNPFKFNVIT